jgi:hypothetical protein
MKKFLLTGILMLMTSMLMAQSLRENEAVVVYYMPKTELVIQMQYTLTTQTPGVFYQYAKRYLGAEHVITEASSQYSLQNIEVSSCCSADWSRAYQVNSIKGFQTQLLSLTADGRLLGYNIDAPASQACKVEEQKNQVADTHTKASVLPLLEEQFVAGTTAKMAEGAAKQIYRIREMRLNLLAGEVEHVPADGTAMQLVLDELEKREAELVALFVGTTSVSTGSHSIRYTPTGNKKQELVCRFSQHNGVVDSDDLSGSPVYIQLACSKPKMEEGEPVASKVPVLAPIYYNLPGHATVAVEYNGKKMHEGRFAVAQMGVAVPLSMDLFSGKPMPSIRINPETGNILSIKQ